MSQTPSWLVRGLDGEGAVRLLAVEIAQVNDEVARAHGLTREAAKLSAQCLVATALMSAYIKGEERVMLQVQGERPAVSFVGEVDAQGTLRGRLTPDTVPNFKALSGLMLVIKSDDKKELYRGVSKIDSGIEDALRGHFETSNQVDVLLSMTVQQDASGLVTYAAGLLVERLPAHAELATLSSAEFVEKYSPVVAAPLQDTLTEMALGSFAGTKWNVLERRDLVYGCRCSREKVAGMLIGLGEVELRSMRVEDGSASVNCDFCTKAYTYSAAELAELEAYASGNTNV
jgi:molecular chaperone Hsp33